MKAIKKLIAYLVMVLAISWLIVYTGRPSAVWY